MDVDIPVDGSEIRRMKWERLVISFYPNDFTKIHAFQVVIAGLLHHQRHFNSLNWLDVLGISTPMIRNHYTNWN